MDSATYRKYSYFVPNAQLIDVIIISTPGSSRIDPLLEVLNKVKYIEVHIVEATMYNSKNDKRAINRRGQRAVYGHELPDGLIGCAISHQNAYQLVAALGNSAIILEDDARIPSLENFEMMVSHFFSSHSKGSNVLSLLPWKHKEPCSGKTFTLNRLLRLVGRTPLTVGYAITLEAAIELSQANPNLKYAPDWPPSCVTYFSSVIGVISHGDLKSGSTIQHVRREAGKSRLKRLINAVFVDFWRYRGEFSSPKEYFILKIKPSLTWRIDDFRGKRMARKLSL